MASSFRATRKPRGVSAFPVSATQNDAASSQRLAASPIGSVRGRPSPRRPSVPTRDTSSLNSL